MAEKQNTQQQSSRGAESTRVPVAMADELLSSPPRDTYNSAYWVYFLLGISYMLPWNTFIAAIDYFGLLYPWGHISRVFAMSFNFTSVIAALLLTFFGLLIPAAWRVNSGLVVSMAVLALVPAMNIIFISNNDGTVATYAITVTALAVCGITHAIVYGSVVASSSRYLPRRYLQALTSGAGASGLLSSTLRIISKAVMPQTESGTVASAYLYFAFCVVIMIACFISYNLEEKLAVICYYKCLKSSEPETEYLLNDSVEKGDGLSSHGMKFYKHVWSQIQGYALSLGFIYLVTLSIFPGHITEDLTSSYFGDWYPLVLISCNNLFDVIGRTLTGFSIFMPSKKAFVIGGSVARIAFYPLYYLVLHGPEFFQLEVVAMVITSIFGLTHGYFNSVLLILGPKSVPPHEAETAGFLMITLLQIGLVSGSVVQWVWVL